MRLKKLLFKIMFADNIILMKKIPNSIFFFLKLAPFVGKLMAAAQN